LAGRFSLIVAADRYSDEKLSELRAPSSDAESLGSVLADPNIGGFEVVSVINRSAQYVREEVERFFKNREPEDTLLLYFACHGIKDHRGRLYLAMTDTRLGLLASTGVAAHFVNEQLEYCRSRRIVLMLDCCYSGAYTRGLAPRSDSSVGVFDSFEGRGRVILTASDALEYAFEDNKLKTSMESSAIFTGAVVRGLRTGDADIDKDGRVSVDELYDFTYNEVRSRTSSQTPGKVSSVSGSIYLAANPRIPTPSLTSAVDPFAAAGSERRWEREDASLELRKLTETDDDAIAQAAQKALSATSWPRLRLARLASDSMRCDQTRSARLSSVCRREAGRRSAMTGRRSVPALPGWCRCSGCATCVPGLVMWPVAAGGRCHRW
jgi:Caspase domain